ncbi:MAG: hypothetical protein ACRDWV_04905 [Acidimicrobiales bacterium]
MRLRPRLRARRSTVVLVVAFLGLGVLYFEVQPAKPATTTTKPATTVPASPTTTVPASHTYPVPASHATTVPASH